MLYACFYAFFNNMRKCVLCTKQHGIYPFISFAIFQALRSDMKNTTRQEGFAFCVKFFFWENEKRVRIICFGLFALTLTRRLPVLWPSLYMVWQVLAT